MLPAGDDPDNFIQKQGGAAYQEQLRQSRPYLEYLLDRAAAEYDFATAEDRREFLNRMLEVAARIPDAAARDQFADRLSHKAQITEEVVRAEIRKAAVQKRTDGPGPGAAGAGPGSGKNGGKGPDLGAPSGPGGGPGGAGGAGTGDTDGLATRSILEQARSLQEWPAARLPETLIAASKQWRGLAGGRNRPPEPPTRRPCRLCPDAEALAVRPRARRCPAGNRPAPGAGRGAPRGRNRLASGRGNRFYCSRSRR